MGVAMKQFIDKFKAMEKVANEALAANPEALAGVNSLPGSEHDAPVPAEAKKPDAEVTQGQPAGATSTDGAVNGGDAKPLNEGKLEMDQPLLNPEKKPLVTDDALTAKEANDHLTKLVGDLLADLNAAPVQKQAQCGGGEGATHAATPAPAKKEEKKEEPEKKDGGGGEKKAGENRVAIKLDDETISKIAAAQAVFMAGREAAGKAIKQAGEQKQTSAEDTAESARALIKAACVKAAQEAGLDPAAAEAAAGNAMAAAGMAPAEAAAADAGAAEAAAAEAGADAGAADAGLPEDVTEEELATAIVDLVNSGELDPDTAKALVEEIAGDEGGAAPTEDQAAEIIAQGLESGEITPEQAQQIAAAVEAGAGGEDAAAAAADAGAASAEAQGAADAEAAAQEAADEAQGAADAEAAIKSASEMIRRDTLAKVASHIVAKRNEKAASAVPGNRVMAKVAGILDAKVKAKKEAEKAAADNHDDASYIAGFKKKAEEMGIDPAKLARYVCEIQKAQAK